MNGSLLQTGALESIKESQRRSREAGRRVQTAGGILGESSTKRQQADDLLKRNGEFERQLRQNENDLRDLDGRVDRLNSGIVDLNEKVFAFLQFTLNVPRLGFENTMAPSVSGIWVLRTSV